MLSEAEYRHHVTGLPEGTVHAVTNPDTGESFDFAGSADGMLVHTIASLYDGRQPDGGLLGSTQELYLGLASYQMKVAGSTTVLWACQDPDDAEALQRLLENYERELRAVAPLGSIAVSAVVPDSLSVSRMTSSASTVGAGLLIPVGQPLGVIAEPGGPTAYHVRLGTTIHRLGLPEATVWLWLHSVRPGTTRGPDRGSLAQVDLADRGVDDIAGEVEHLLGLGLVIELPPGDKALTTAFAMSYRLVPLQFSIGNTPGDFESYVLVAGQEPTTRVDLPMLRTLAEGLRAPSMAIACYTESGGIAIKLEDSRYDDPDYLAEHLVRTLHVVLAVQAAYLDVALEPGETDDARKASLDRTAVIDDAAIESYGVYARGYLTGARYMWLGLEGVIVSLGGRELELKDEASWFTWTAAHGVADGEGLDDSIDAICAIARDAGAPQPIFDIDDLTARRLMEQPQTGAELIEFAATNRLEPLLAGIGNGVEHPNEYWLGVDPQRPVTSVPAQAYEVWRTAPLSYSLLDAAHAAGRAGSVSDLRAYLRVVQLLCLRRAAFIDEVRPR